jgi:subfamily B ATP-binding cassette protein MsbA
MLVSTAMSGVQLGSIFVIADRIVANKEIPTVSWMPDWLVQLVVWLNQADQLMVLTATALTIPGLFLMIGLFRFWQDFFMNDVSQRVIRDLRAAIFERFMALSLQFHSKHDTGSLMSRIVYDTGVIQNSITEGLSELLLNLMKTALFLAVPLMINWKLTLMIFVIVPLIGAATAYIGKQLKKLSAQSQVAMGQLSNAIHEGLAGIRIVKSFLSERFVTARFLKANTRSYAILRKSHKRMNMLSPITEFIGACAGAFFFWYGGRQVILGYMSLGAFMAFLASILQLIHPLKRLARLHGINQQAIAAAERIFDVLDTKASVAEADDPVVLPQFHHEIVFNHVSFQYDKQPVLRDINLTIPRGQVIALVGPSGGGKTTLANLLSRFFDPVSGHITIDGLDIRQASLASLRAQVGLVTQETFLFNESVRTNIALGKPQASLAEVMQAAELAGAHEFIEKLPQGYDTLVGEGGGLLSGGQRQRIAIARAFLKNPPILILDEATSQLDAQSEHVISQALARLTAGRTVLLIAHRISSVRLAHRILVMQEGRILEEGTHDELLQKSPLYKRFCELQLMHAGDEDSSAVKE